MYCYNIMKLFVAKPTSLVKEIPCRNEVIEDVVYEEVSDAETFVDGDLELTTNLSSLGLFKYYVTQQ